MEPLTKIVLLYTAFHLCVSTIEGEVSLLKTVLASPFTVLTVLGSVEYHRVPSDNAFRAAWNPEPVRASNAMLCSSFCRRSQTKCTVFLHDKDGKECFHNGIHNE